MTYEEMEKSLLEFSRLAQRDGQEWRERMDRDGQEWRERMDRDGQEWRERISRIESERDRDGQEWRGRMERLDKSSQELRDAQLVHIRLMDSREKEWHELFAPLVGVVGNHENEIVALREAVRSHEDGIAELRGAMAQLFQRMDRFIQGLERENGKKQQ